MILKLKNVSIPSLPEDVDIVVTHKSLTDRAIAVRPNAIHYFVIPAADKKLSR